MCLISRGHLKPVILKPVGRMSILGEFDLPGVVLGASSDAHSALQKKGCRLLARNCSDRASESLGQKDRPRWDMRMTGFRRGPLSWERTQKREPHKLFRGISWGQKGGPKRAIFGHKKFSLLFFFFSALTCDRNFFITVRFFSGIYFGIALHSFYRIYFLAEIILLYIKLSRPQPLSCTSFLFTLHYIKNSRSELILRCITLRLHANLFSEF